MTNPDAEGAMDGAMRMATAGPAARRIPDFAAQARLYDRLERALAIIAERQGDQPGLDAIAAEVGISPFHFQRLFTRWVGVSPKKFLRYLTLGYAKERLAESASVLDAAYESGLSGPGRLHDLFVTLEATTPGEFKRRGAGLVIRSGFAPSPFGDCLVMTTDRGLCGLAFAAESGRAGVLADMTGRWPAATFVEAPDEAQATAARVFAPAEPGAPPLPLHLCGTNFQIRVWEALLRIPPGALVTYGDLARLAGEPTAARAVGAAVGRNPVSVVVPCHRAILGNGYIRNYAWGRPRKLALIGWEAARREAAG